MKEFVNTLMAFIFAASGAGIVVGFGTFVAGNTTDGILLMIFGAVLSLHFGR